ncbi:hypothetical protein ACRS6B_25290 [Nocardia asteroides]
MKRHCPVAGVHGQRIADAAVTAVCAVLAALACYRARVLATR